MAERLTPRKAFSVALLCCAVTLSALSIIAPFHLLVLAYILYSFFASTVWAPINALVVQLTPSEARGRSYSAYFLIQGVFGSLAPVLAASVLELTSVWIVLPLSVVFFLASMGILSFSLTQRESNDL